MRILIDLDGVVADFVQAWCDEANRYYLPSMIHLSPSDITEWMMHKNTNGYMTREESESIWLENGFFLRLKPIDDAFNGILDLYKSGHEIVFVSFCKRGFEDKLSWLQKETQYYGIKYETIFTHAKHMIDGDVFIDDYPENCKAWQTAHPTGTAICFAAPYNTHYEGLRIGNWKQVLNKISELSLSKVS